MRLGMPTLSEFDTIQENVELCKKLGLDFIELNMDLPYCFPNVTDWNLVDKKNIEFTVHLSEKIEVGNIYELVRRQQIEQIKDSVIYYKKVANVKKYNLHLDRGVYFNLPDKKIYIFEKYEKDYLKSIKKSIEEISNFAKKEDVLICFENVKMTSFIEKAFLKVIEYPNLYYTLDIGHDAKDKELASKLFMKNPQKIKHMHIHDFDGEKDHKELGIGLIDIQKYYNFCKENDIDAVIEVKREHELENSVKYLRDNIM